MRQSRFASDRKLPIPALAQERFLSTQQQHIVASKTIYGGSYNILAHTLPLSSGITTSFVDISDEEELESAIKEELADQGIKPNIVRFSIGIEKS